jgi:hypothetical protein
VFTLGEVMTGDVLNVAEYQTTGGLDGLLNYPLFYKLIDTFVTGKEGLGAL